MAIGKAQYKEFRKDGWPFCPNCKEDELYSQFSSWRNGVEVSPIPTMDDLINHGLRCYRCWWQSSELDR